MRKSATVEECLELVAPVASNRSNAEWELFDPIVDEVDRMGLGVVLLDLQCTNLSRVVDHRVR